MDATTETMADTGLDKVHVDIEVARAVRAREALIVAWLRSGCGKWGIAIDQVEAREIADAIEQGAHLL